MTSSNALKTAVQNFERAVAEFERTKTTLLRSDGAKRFGDKEHQERLQHFLQPLTAAAAEAKATADAALTAARQAKAIQHADPVASLSDSELSRAYHLRPFVQDAVNDMTLTELAQRLAAVVASGDKAQIACYHQAAIKRSEAQRLAYRDGDITALEGVTSVVQHIEAMGSKLADPKVAKQLEDANELERVAFESSFTVSARLSELNGEQEAANVRRKAEYQAMF